MSPARSLSVPSGAIGPTGCGSVVGPGCAVHRGLGGRPAASGAGVPRWFALRPWPGSRHSPTPARAARRPAAVRRSPIVRPGRPSRSAGARAAAVGARPPFNRCVTVATDEKPQRRVGGGLAAPSAPGIGLPPRADVLGEPVVVIEQAARA